MSARVAIIADDLTGAADTAVAFLAAPMSAAVRWPDASTYAREGPNVDTHRDATADTDRGTNINATLESSDGAVAFDTSSRGTDERFARWITGAVVSACS